MNFSKSVLPIMAFLLLGFRSLFIAGPAVKKYAARRNMYKPFKSLAPFFCTYSIRSMTEADHSQMPLRQSKQSFFTIAPRQTVTLTGQNLSFPHVERSHCLTDVFHTIIFLQSLLTFASVGRHGSQAKDNASLQNTRGSLFGRE